MIEELVILFLMSELNCMISEHVWGVVGDCVQRVIVHDKSVVNARTCSVQILHFQWLPYYFNVDFVFLWRLLHLYNLFSIDVNGLMRGPRSHFDGAHLELLYLWRLIIPVIPLPLSVFLHLLCDKIINLQFRLIMKALTNLARTFMAYLSFNQIVTRSILLMKYTSHKPWILNLSNGALYDSGSQRHLKLPVFFLDFWRSVDLLFESFRDVYGAPTCYRPGTLRMVIDRTWIEVVSAWPVILSNSIIWLVAHRDVFLILHL